MPVTDLRDIALAPRSAPPKPIAPERTAAAAVSADKPAKAAEPQDKVAELSAAAKIAVWAEASRKDPLVLRLAETARKMRAENDATIRDLRDPLADWQIRAIREKSGSGPVSYELSRKSGAPGKAVITPGPNGARDATIQISEPSHTLSRALNFALGALRSGRLAGL
jgi:rhodanese-related sulfurtransferase